MEPTLAEIRMFAGNFAPRAWAFCQGQLLPISQNQALFSLLGTTFGGDGRTTFALPDLRGRAAVHAGNGPGLSDRRLGAKGGSENNTLTVSNLASHNHSGTFHTSSTIGTAASPVGAYPAALAGRTTGNPPVNAMISGYSTTAGTAMMNPSSIVVGNTGGNIPVNNMQPFTVLNYIIALQGIYPSRS